MGYFSNGTDGEIYKEEHCYKCKNWTVREGETEEGCPIWDMHLIDNYELCNTVDNYLDKFIPRTTRDAIIEGSTIKIKIRCNDKCRMFLKK